MLIIINRSLHFQQLVILQMGAFPLENTIKDPLGDWKCSLVVGHMFSMCWALGSSPCTKQESKR